MSLPPGLNHHEETVSAPPPRQQQKPCGEPQSCTTRVSIAQAPPTHLSSMLRMAAALRGLEMNASVSQGADAARIKPEEHPLLYADSELIGVASDGLHVMVE